MINAPPTETRPLSATLACISERDDYLASDCGPLEAGWLPATALLDRDGSALAQQLAHAISEHATTERRIAGALFIGAYTWHLAAAVGAAYLAEARVPDVRPDNIALRYCRYTWHEAGEHGEGERLTIRFLSERFTALPNDPAAGQGDVWIVPDRTALRDDLRRSLERHLSRLIAAIHTASGLGQRAQWNLAADAIAASFLYIGTCLGSQSAAQAEALALLKVAGSPLFNPRTGYVTVEVGGHCATFRARGGCCLSYRLVDHTHCTTCVLRPAAERDQRLRAYVARKHHLPPEA